MTRTDQRDALPPICVLAGGRGTRLGDLTESIPKSLIEVAGAPFINHQLRLLARHGADRVVLCVGHLGERIERWVGDGSAFGLTVTYAYDPPGLAGTAGAVRGALPLLGDLFLVLYGDTYLLVEYQDFVREFLSRRLPAQMAVLRNEGRWDTSNVKVEEELVARYDKRNPDPAMQWIDFGLSVFRSEVFATGAGETAADLAAVYSELAASRRLGAYVAEHRFYEIGSPEGLAETERFLGSLPVGSNRELNEN